MRRLATRAAMGAGIFAVWISGALWARADDAANVRAQWNDPPRQYSNGPLWVWNDMLTEEQVKSSLRDLASQKVKQAFVHPRPGLMTPYLSPDWFRLWKAALTEARRLDMNLWIYDENSYPSGFAGGWVPQTMPESRGRTLVFRTVKEVAEPGPEVLGVFRVAGERVEDHAAAARAGQKLAGGPYLVASVQRSAPSPWHANRTYVDLMYPGVTQKFLEVTHEAYRRELGDEFGRHIPGSFTDEPRLEARGGLPWTDDLPQVFEKRWGYSVLAHLPSLARNVGDWRRVRHNFVQVLNDLFIERWSKPYHDYCEKHGLEWTGHYWDHEWPNCQSVPDNMAMYAWHQRPAIDCLMNQYKEDVHGQFGNARMVRELASVSHQIGQRRTLCETYGAGGWDLRFEDMKRIGDWLCALGVNTIDEHLSYITLRGARKHDHPQSFSYHEPWWPDYHVMAQYFARLSLALSQGTVNNHILVIEPTTSAWMYQFAGDAAQRDHLNQLGDDFQTTVMKLEKGQIEYDLGSEDIIARHGKVEMSGSKANRHAQFCVGQGRYDVVLLPPGTENLNSKTLALLSDFAKAGKLISCVPPPERIDGQQSTAGDSLTRARGWSQVLVKSGNDLSGVDDLILRLRLKQQSDSGFTYQLGPSKLLPFVFHQRRQLDGGQLLFIVNTSIDHPIDGLVECSKETGIRSAEWWDAESGRIRPYSLWPNPDVEGKACDTTVLIQVPPCGSRLLFLSIDRSRPSPQPPAGRSAVLTAGGVLRGLPMRPAGSVSVRRLEPNVLPLDFVDISCKGETTRDCYYYRAAQIAFMRNGMKHNPWDSAVQFGDEIIREKFPADSGFMVSYRFTVEKAVPADLAIVIERPDLYAITCNGQPVVATPGAWWLDKAFGRIELAKVARVGENVITLKARPMSVYHEIEPAYVLGDFSLKSAEKGFVIAPPEPLRVGAKGWNEQGHPFYAAGVAYRQTFQLNEVAKGAYYVELPKWYGSVARVSLNGQAAGHIFHAPWTCDVTKLLKPGENVVEVTVVGTLKNTLGPHHGKPALGAAWPAQFHKAPEQGPPPGKEYDTVGYGLFGDIEVEYHGP